MKGSFKMKTDINEIVSDNEFTHEVETELIQILEQPESVENFDCEECNVLSQPESSFIEHDSDDISLEDIYGSCCQSQLATSDEMEDLSLTEKYRK